MDFPAPPSSLTGPISDYCRAITAAFQRIPQVSYFTAASPNGVVQGVTGDQAIYVGSTSTQTCLWIKASTPRVVSATSWVKVGIVV